MTDFIEKILNGVKSGKIHVIFCEPLKSMHWNLAFCPYRDECKWLDDLLFSGEDLSGIQDLVMDLTCWACPEDEWLVVVSEQGAIATFAVDQEIGKSLKEEVERILSVPEPLREMLVSEGDA